VNGFSLNVAQPGSLQEWMTRTEHRAIDLARYFFELALGKWEK
jgi:hypothetical protein